MQRARRTQSHPLVGQPFQLRDRRRRQSARTSIRTLCWYLPYNRRCHGINSWRRFYTGKQGRRKGAKRTWWRCTASTRRRRFDAITAGCRPRSNHIRRRTWERGRCRVKTCEGRSKGCERLPASCVDTCRHSGSSTRCERSSKR